jgi:hypothetical protein
MSTLDDSPYPQTGSNRTRAEVRVDIADMLGGANKPDIKSIADRAWARAVREFNAYAWSFNRVTDDIIIDSSMKANTTVPVVTNTGSGVGFTLESGRQIVYWIEERRKNGQRVLERNDTLDTTSGLVIVTLVGTGAVMRPVITRPAQLNPEATHWALFGTASTHAHESTDAAYPHGYEIAEVAMDVTTIEDNREGINPGMPANATIYQSGEYDLSSPFHNPVRAMAIDGSGQTRYGLTWIPWRRWTAYRPWQITTGSVPLWYTIRNWHQTGKVTFDPRPGSKTTYPMIRIIYSTPIVLPGDSGILNVPQEVDDAIFQRASVIARRNTAGPGAVGPDELREEMERKLELEAKWRDFPDF